MFFTLNAPGSPGRYYPINSPTSTNGAVGGPNVVNQNVTPVNQASTIVGLEIDTETAATDTTEKWNLYVNGVATGDSVTVVNGTTRGVTAGLSVALVAGDFVSLRNDPGASGLVGRQMITTYVTTP